jgi:DNA invertase Pin-like site-specific DNA recombinase
MQTNVCDGRPAMLRERMQPSAIWPNAHVNSHTCELAEDRGFVASTMVWKIMNSVFYRRCSTDEQDAGLKAQLDACMTHAQRAGLEVVGDFFDDGISGAAPLDKRPGLLDALSVLGTGDVLLVAKRDRLGRDPIVVAMIEAAVNRQGARVVSAAGEGTDGDDPTNVLMRRIVDAFAEYERLIIKAQTRSALAAKKRRGQRTGSVPIGFDLVDDGERSKAGFALALAPNPVEQATMALVRELKAGGMPLRRIARELDARGITPKRGGERWSVGSVARILEKPVQPAGGPS